MVASAVSGLEISIKRQLGKLPPLPSDIRAACLQMGPGLADVTFEDAAGVEALPLHHRDLFDRPLVSQARRLGATLVSADDKLAPIRGDDSAPLIARAGGASRRLPASPS